MPRFSVHSPPKTYYADDVPEAILALTGQHVSRATTWRWMLKGVQRMGQRVKLPFSYVGVRRIVAHDALLDFLKPINPAVNPVAQRTPAERRRAAQAAGKKLQEMGA